MFDLRRGLTLALAVGVLAVAVGMASASALQRAASPVDRTLLLALSCALVASVHLLPSLCRGWWIWPLWGLCFAVAVYGHAGFFSHAGLQAAEARQAASPHTLALRQRQEAVTAALEAIKARPVAVVASQLARTVSPERRQTLELELTEAQRAAALRDQTVNLAAQGHARAATEGVTDPVTLSVARVLGVSAQAVGLALNMAMAALVELLGIVLWLQVMRPASPVHVQSLALVEPSAQALPPDSVTDPLAILRAAVERGEVRPTVTSIRSFMSCSQIRASELRRVLDISTAQSSITSQSEAGLTPAGTGIWQSWAMRTT
jgi:hypothetical protein